MPEIFRLSLLRLWRRWGASTIARKYSLFAFLNADKINQRTKKASKTWNISPMHRRGFIRLTWLRTGASWAHFQPGPIPWTSRCKLLLFSLCLTDIVMAFWCEHWLTPGITSAAKQKWLIFPQLSSDRRCDLVFRILSWVSSRTSSFCCTSLVDFRIKAYEFQIYGCESEVEVSRLCVNSLKYSHFMRNF